MAIYTGLFELVEINRIENRVLEYGESGNKNIWRLVAQLDTGQILEFFVEYKVLRALIAINEKNAGHANKSALAGRRYLTSLDRSTLITLTYRVYPDGEIWLLSWWEAADKAAQSWGTHQPPVDLNQFFLPIHQMIEHFMRDAKARR